MSRIRVTPMYGVDEGEVGTGHEPDGLCGNRTPHPAHMVREGTLAPFWCTANESQREPGRSERRRG
jgi:hypothetical protein